MIELAWHERAACRGEDTNLFYVDEREEPATIAMLRTLCAGCEVFDECRTHSLMWEQYGFWSNLTESERVVERRRIGNARRSFKTSRT